MKAEEAAQVAVEAVHAARLSKSEAAAAAKAAVDAQMAAQRAVLDAADAAGWRDRTAQLEADRRLQVENPVIREKHTITKNPGARHPAFV